MVFLLNPVLLIWLTVLLSACGLRENLAPVVESRWRTEHTRVARHVVMRGETLYALSFQYDQDYERLAQINQLRPPYTLHVGQVLQLKTALPKARSIYHPPAAIRRHQEPPATSRARWLWPAEGRIMTTFAPNSGRKGIDIAGKKGEKIRAASTGIVAYAGNGLSGYGNLIIIKHNQHVLTAYGNNLRNLVHEGQHITTGQVIAEMGVIDRRYWGLHFEIRQGGNPVDPRNYLKKS